MTKKLAFGLVALLVASVVIAVTPAATAQAGEKEPKISVDGDVKPTGAGLVGGRLPPETATATVTVKFKVEIPPQSGCVGQVFSVDYKQLDPKPYMQVTVSPKTEAKSFKGGDTPSGGVGAVDQGYTWTGWQTTATVAFTRQAPAFVDVPIRIQATLNAADATSSGCNVVGSPQTEAETLLKPDYLPSIQILPDTIIQTSGQNKRVVFPVTIINFGNGPTRVASNIVERSSGLESIVPPSELVLESKATSGEKAQNSVPATVTVITPSKNGYTNKVYAFDAVFNAKSETTAQDLLTQEVTVPLSIKVQGVYVPGFDAVSLIAGLGVALLGLGAMRRRYD